MRCENPTCPDPDHYILCLAPSEDGRDSRFLCLPCCKSFGLYCVRHERAHTSFSTGGHACLRCIEREVRMLKPYADVHYSHLISNLPVDELGDLREWAEVTGEIMGDTNQAITVLRAIVTSAMRRKLTHQQVIAEVIASRSVRSILP